MQMWVFNHVSFICPAFRLWISRRLGMRLVEGHNTCYVPVLQIIPEGILTCSVRNLEGTDTKISYNEHLLSQSGKSEGKDASLAVSHHPYDQKRQNHAGQCIDKTPCNIPDHVLPSDIRSLI